ncbi:MarR family transcriptional regulator [Paraburkholderia sp. JHI2823]|uniref:MarR family winged helix-turn-helix transcriptional regulator n=1 Tax=Paraburkholderia sp. JHI2823 TaxID=3112960 RepID=UPI003179DD1D
MHLQKPPCPTHRGYVGALKYAHRHRPLTLHSNADNSITLDRAGRIAGASEYLSFNAMHTEHKSSSTFDALHNAGNGVSSDIARNCLLTRTGQISRVLTAIYDDALRPFGVNAPQFSMLVLIVEHGPLSRSDLGRKNHHDRSTLTRNLQPLISQGWVAEGLPGGDGRSRPLSLTEQGKALLNSAAPAWSSAQTNARALLGEAGANALMGIAGELPRRTS